MTTEQQDDLKQALYNHKWISDIEEDDPLVNIWFSDLVDLIDRLNKANKQ